MTFCLRGYIHAFLLLLVLLASARADDAPTNPEPSTPDEPRILRDGFESNRPSWREEATDATVLLRAHDRTQELAHEGRFSERFLFEADHGSGIHYSYKLPPSPLSADLSATLYVRSNRTGAQLFARVILPEDIDPNTGQPTALLIPGTSLTRTNHWERLEVAGLPLTVERQAWVVRQDTGRPVSVRGAYLDSLVINLYEGAAPTEIELDELAVGPLRPMPESEKPRLVRPASSTPPSEITEPPRTDPPPAAAATAGSGRVQVVGSVLQRDGKDWFPRIIAAPGADIEQLRRAGPDVLAIDPTLDPAELTKALELGYLLMPRIPLAADSDPQAALSFPLKDSVAFWDLGTDLGGHHDLGYREAEIDRVRQAIRSLHALPPNLSRLSEGTVSGMFPQFALFGQSLDLIGVRADDACTSTEPMSTFHYLEQRRMLTATKNPTALFLAWVPASAPRVLQSAIWGEDVPPSWGWPQIQPEQIRLYTYAALSAGYRGIGFRAFADLSQPSGLDRLYEMTLLIAEIELLETIFARAHDPILKLPTFPPDPKIKLQYKSSGQAGGLSGLGRSNGQVKDEQKEREPLKTTRASVIDLPDGRSKLLVVADFAAGAQVMPSLMAQRELNILVPAAVSAQAFEITLGGVTPLTTRGDTGGRRIVLPVFNTTALILLTPDLSLVEPLRAQIQALAPRAVDIAIKQAELQLQETETIHALLTQQGRPVRQGDDLILKAKNELQKARDYQARLEFDYAWSFARSVGQALRSVRRAHWEHAMRLYTYALRIREKTDGLPPQPVKVMAKADGQGEQAVEQTRWRQPAVIVNAVECPPLLAWQSLPHFYQSWLPAIAPNGPPFGPNLMSNGHFEVSPQALREAGWKDESYATEGVTASVSLSQNDGYMPKTTALKFKVLPNLDLSDLDKSKFVTPEGKPDENAYFEALRQKADKTSVPYLDHPAAAVRTPPVSVKANHLVRIRVLVKMPRQIVPGAGGLIVRDSLGGQRLQVKVTGGVRDWSEVVIFRRVPADTELSVLLGMAGYGIAFFDQLRIDVLGDVSNPASSPALPNPSPLARQPLPRRTAVQPPLPPVRPRR